QDPESWVIQGTGAVPAADPEPPSVPEDLQETPPGGTAFRWLATIALGLAGYLLNLLPVQLSPGTDMVFGGIPALLAAVAFGPILGFVAEGLAAARTVEIWGHPYGWLNFTLEATVVGLIVHWRGSRPMVADLVFWAALGLPLLYLTSTIGLG